MPFRKRWAAMAARSRVSVCMLLGAAACFLSRPTVESVATGLPVALAGLAIRAWAAGHLRKNERLAASGPYAHVRNPLYIGSLLAGVGLGIGTNRFFLLGAVLVVFVFWFLPVVAEEEEHIRKILPGYLEYERRVPRFLPVAKARYGAADRFDFNLYLKNREYAAGLGVLGFFAILYMTLYLR